jgi:hypothetical protein
MSPNINPWLGLSPSAPFVLAEDRLNIEAFNANISPNSPYRFDVETVIPEPFIGNVTTANVVVLQLNPGHDPVKDPASHADPLFRSALFANLRHDNNAWPFYFFNPQFINSHPGGIWWKSKTKKLAEVIPLQELGQRLAVVEWFPYKSQKYKGGCDVPSQKYGFSLVSAAIDRGALIVISRSVSSWENSVPALRNYSRKLTLSSVQNVALTSNNLKHQGEKTAAAWDMLIDALR